MTTGSTGEIVVFGAGGRAGRALVHEARARGHRVIGVVRDPHRHPDLSANSDGAFRVIAADLTDRTATAAALSESEGRAAVLVNAVTPFTAPPESFEDFDDDHFVSLVDTLADLSRPTGARVVEIGLFATLRTDTGRVVDDPEAFPPFFRPFGQARVRGLDPWDHHRDVDWLVATPPPGLSPDAPRTGRYVLTDGTLASDLAHLQLSYADLAVAVLDEIETPAYRRTQVGVHAAP